MIRHALALAVLAATATLAHAETSGSDWKTFQKEGKCWAAIGPVQSEGSIAGREGQFLSIQNHPSEGVRGSVAIVSGFASAGEGSVKVTVDNEGFEVLPFGNAAFAASGKPEAALIAAMRRGHELAVTWTTEEGETATDRYSLSGFAASKSSIDAACR